MSAAPPTERKKTVWFFTGCHNVNGCGRRRVKSGRARVRTSRRDTFNEEGGEEDVTLSVVSCLSVLGFKAFQSLFPPPPLAWPNLTYRRKKKRLS